MIVPVPPGAVLARIVEVEITVPEYWEYLVEYDAGVTVKTVPVP